CSRFVVFSLSFSSFFSLYYLLLSLQTYSHYQFLHSFPTRRSSDLGSISQNQNNGDRLLCGNLCSLRVWLCGLLHRHVPVPGHSRSEEHTSELQSRFDLVCRLLLEKKKMKNMKKL